MNNAQKPFVVVDGSSYLFRAYFALPPLTNSKGKPTGAIYGVINMLRRLKKDYDPEHLVVVFDSKEKTFRHALYHDYKANREVMPEDLAIQIKPLHEVIRALGFPLVVKPGIEADDVIATLARIAEKHGLKTVISTADKDLAQLVNDNITLVNTMTGHTMDSGGVKEKFGVPPDRIIDYLTLVGDTSDNIPGVPKVGPKTAAKWLEEYGSLKNIIKHADKFTGKVGEYLRESLAHLPLTEQLVTLKEDIQLNITPEDFHFKELDRLKLVELFTELEFKNWLRDVGGEAVSEPEAKEISEKNAFSIEKFHYKMVLTEKELMEVCHQLKAADSFALDTETTSLNAMDAELVGLSFSVKKREAVYIPVAHEYEGAPEQLTREHVLEVLKPIIERKKSVIIGQNLKYDYKILKQYGIELEVGTLYDTMLESYVLNTTSLRHDLETLAEDYLQRKLTSYKVVTHNIKSKNFAHVPLKEATEYAAEDAEVALELHQTLMHSLEKDSDLLQVLEKIELPLMPVLARMEYQGVLVDVEKLNAQSQSIKKRLKKLEDEIYKQAGSVFNISSSKQLQTILFEHLKLPVIKKTPTGQPSTAESVLQELAHEHEFPLHILEFRSLSKLKTTYTDRLPKEVNAKTGRIHTSYRQAVTVTGRLASQNPNLQNIPIRTEEGRKIRQAFIAAPGYQLMSADYSQVELRIMASLSNDKNLIKAFEEGLDIHRATASEVFGMSYERVTPEQRRHAKAVNFGLLYGMSAYGLSQQIGVERAIAAEYIDIYFKRYPRVKEYIENIRRDARKNHFVRTLLGRKIHVPDVISKNSIRRKAAERAAINAPLQGTAADIIKLAMITMDRTLREEKLDAVMIMQVHDELVFEVADKEVNALKKIIPQVMENAVKLPVPLIVDVGVGNNWDEAH